MDNRAVIETLKAAGWELKAARGGRHPFTLPTKPGEVTGPHPVKDTPLPTLRSIEKQSGLSLG